MYNQTNRKREPYDKAHLSFGLQRYCFFRYSANISLFCQRKVANAADSLFTSAKKTVYRSRKTMYFRTNRHIFPFIKNLPYTFPTPQKRRSDALARPPFSISFPWNYSAGLITTSNILPASTSLRSVFCTLSAVMLFTAFL